ncbi:MAG TPA: tetratricopeptide repeat protein [Gemmatimonadaceae bacterium]|nr:tetratricopeptide repeat protein [Gemmatimonadaceae bacterium]
MRLVTDVCRRVTTVLAATLLACTAMEAAAQAGRRGDHGTASVDFPISCSAAAQVEFNRAVTLLHHMTYPRARETFRRVAEVDPQCAMAHWGIAMTMFQPLWPTRPGARELKLGRDAARAASRLNPPTDRERMFVASVAAFFEQDSLAYWQRVRGWEQSMAKLFAALPSDPEVRAFYALAHLAIAPSNDSARMYSDRAAEILAPVYERNPDHPGAMHYLIHANDAAGRERESPDVVLKYEASAPANPHALHMPTHIYTRLGEWDAVVRGNLRAADAALAHPSGDSGQYVWDEFPHAIEYLVYAYLQQGADDLARTQLTRLHRTARLEPTFKTAFHLASTRARYALERRAWSEAMSLPVREGALDWDRFKWPEAVTWFARGLGAAHEGDLGGAHAAAARLAELERSTGASGEALFARHIRVLRLEVDAWIAQVSGKRDSAVALMREAVELEASTPKHAVTPAPTLPAAELFGDMLLEQGKPADALAAYRRSASGYPRRFNGLLGAARAARQMGNDTLARAMYEQLIRVATGGGRERELSEARGFLGRR